MEVTRILHASMNVAGKLEESGRFYEDVLGLPGAVRPDVPGVGGRWFKADAAQVHLVDAPASGHGIDPVGPHVCFGVPDLAAAKAELDERSIPWFSALQDVPDGSGRQVEQVWFVDPAGNTIELQDDPRP